MMSLITLHLHNSVMRGNQFIGDISERCPDWRHTIRRIGGYWTATATYRGDRDELDDLFFDGLLREVRATRDGFDLWQGFLGGMTYVRDGLPWTQTVTGLATAVKALYLRLGDNLLTNGGAESGPWTAVNAATVVQSTEWVNEGAYSCKITVLDSTVRGADIQASLTIAAGVAYSAGVKVHVVSGSWRIAVNRTDTDAPLAHTSTHGALGDRTIALNIEASNTYAGTVRYRVTSEGAPGVIYCDGATFVPAPIDAETDWKIDAQAAREYGRIEEVLLLPGLSYETANAKALTHLNETAWPVVEPADNFSSLGSSGGPDKLSLTFFGYIFSLRWRMILAAAADTMTNHIKAIAAQQNNYLSAGVIENNPTPYQLDTREPVSLWKMASEIAKAGDESGQRWSLSVTADRKLNYQVVSSDIATRFQQGRPYSPAGGAAFAHLLEPGWAIFDDAPRGPENLSGQVNRVSQRSYIEEIEYVLSTAADGTQSDSVNFHHEAQDNG